MPRPFRLALPAAAGMLAATLLAGLAVPVYTDEVAWRFQTARAPFDGGVDRGLADQCGPNTTLAAPWFLQPMRHLSAGWQAALADPRAVRVTGVALAFVALALLAALARAAGAGRGGLAAALALLGLGTLPWLLVWSRPEQAILLALLAALLLALRAGPGALPAAPWRTGAIVLLAVAALGYHPKAVAFAPVFALAALAAPARPAWRIAGAAAVAGFAAGAAGYWQARLACPGDALIRARQAAESALAGGWSLAGLAANASPLGYVGGTAVARRAMADWLPPVLLPDPAGIAWYAGVAIAWQAALLALAAGIVLAAGAAWRREGGWRAPALAAGIALCLLGWGATQPNKNAYEAALTLPLAAAALLLVWPALRARLPRALALGTRAVVAAAVASDVLLLALYAGPLARAAAGPGYVVAQPHSINPWRYPALVDEIRAAGASCGIGTIDARYLLVDDLTYWTYLRTYRPLHQVAVVGAWRGGIADPGAYLAAHRSSGGVLRCALLPPAMAANRRRFGPFCCVHG